MRHPTQFQQWLVLLLFSNLFFFTAKANDRPQGIFTCWDGGGGSNNDWSEPSNWCDDVLPDGNSDVRIDDGFTVNLDMDVTIGSMTLIGKIIGAGDMTIVGFCSLQGGFANGFFQTGDISVGGSFDLLGATQLANVGNLDIGGFFAVNNGYVGGYNINAPGTITVAGQMFLDRFGNHYFTTKTVICNGGVTESAGNLYLENGATITNSVGSTWTNSQANATYFDASAGPVNGGTINNLGTYDFQNGWLVISPNIVFNNSGTFTLNGQTTFQGEFLNSGTANFTGTMAGGVLYNTGIFENSANLYINATSGITNVGSFLNTGDGIIEINGTGTSYDALHNALGGNFTNQGSIEIGNTSSQAQFGIRNLGTFSNDVSGTIDIGINRTGLTGGAGIYSDSYFYNFGQVVMGSVHPLGYYGIRNLGDFSNWLGGSIQVNHCLSSGIYHESGNFLNAGELLVGTLESVGDYGIEVEAGTVFTNAVGAAIAINRCDYIGLDVQGATFYQNGALQIGNLANVGQYGLTVDGTFEQGNTGVLEIERSSEAGLAVWAGDFLNNGGQIFIGNNFEIGNYGLWNQANFENYGEVYIQRAAQVGLLNEYGGFFNEYLVQISNPTGSSSQFGLVNDFGAYFENKVGGAVEVSQFSMAGIKNTGGSNFKNSNHIELGNGSGSSGQSLINDDANFENAGCSFLWLHLPMQNEFTLENYSTVRFGTATASVNTGTLTNHGILHFPEGTPLTNVDNQAIIVQPNSGDCLPELENALQIGGLVNITIGTDWFSDYAMTSQNGTYDVGTNIFTATDFEIGVPQVAYFTIQDELNGCPAGVYDMEITFLADTELPSIACPDNQTVPTISACSAPLGEWAASATSSDNCTVPSIGQSPVPTFSLTSVGVAQTVVLTATDGAGNAATCSFTVTLTDEDAPVPTIANLPDFDANCSATPPVPTATDNCAGSLNGSTSTVFPITTIGTTVVTWQFDDGNGNVFSQNQNVVVDCDSDGDGYFALAGGDCDDEDPLEFPGQAWYDDLDGDGSGDLSSEEESCERPAGKFALDELSDYEDCDDTDPYLHPNTEWYIDNDGDNYTSVSIEIQCEQPANGHLTSLGGANDCDDNDPLEKPSQIWRFDVDGDGYGSSNFVVQCLRPAFGKAQSELNAGTDCDDNDPNEHPNQTWYIDADGDDYSASSVVQCLRPTNGFLLSEISGTGDCNDGNVLINPNATEICNSADDDCDGTTNEGFDLGQTCTVGIGACQQTGTTICSTDGLSVVCSATPGTPTPEICNGIDDNCDTFTDEGCLKKWLAGTTGNWSDGSKWSPVGVPTASEEVEIYGTTTLDMDASTGNLTVFSNGQISGAGNLEVNGNCLVIGSIVKQGNMEITGFLSVAAFGGFISTSGNVSVGDYLTVNGILSNGGDLDAGSLNLSGNLSTSGSVEVSGDFSFGNGSISAGSGSPQDDIHVAGSTFLSGFSFSTFITGRKLICSGGIQLNGKVHLSGAELVVEQGSNWTFSGVNNEIAGTGFVENHGLLQISEGQVFIAGSSISFSNTGDIEGTGYANFGGVFLNTGWIKPGGAAIGTLGLYFANPSLVTIGKIEMDIKNNSGSIVYDKLVTVGNSSTLGTGSLYLNPTGTIPDGIYHDLIRGVNLSGIGTFQPANVHLPNSLLKCWALRYYFYPTYPAVHLETRPNVQHSFSPTHVTCFNNSDGTIFNNHTGGISPFTYLWSNGKTTKNINLLPAGTYLTTVTSTGGCVSTAGQTTLTQPTELVMTVSTTPTTATISASGGTPSYLYNRTGALTFQPNPVFVGMTPGGTYIFKTKDAKDCQKSVIKKLPTSMGSPTGGSQQALEFEVPESETDLPDEVLIQNFEKNLAVQKQEWRLFPNPVFEKLQIEFSSPQTGLGDIRVFNGFGRQVLFQKIVADAGRVFSMDVSELSEGIYFLEVKNESGLGSTARFVKTELR